SVANDWERDYTYDWLGRRLTYVEGELAESLTYDGSNLSTHTQSWSENGLPQTKTTQYHYNAHRLDSVSYDDALTTIYHYDQYGRVDSLYDESGVVCYQYGKMGEITKETRIYALPFLSQPISLTTQFRYDSWGRVDSIFYPDGERLKYQYDLGGQLQSITNNSNYTYLDNVTYDRFGAKTSQKYGNGLKTNYSYNSLTRRLSGITTMDGNSQVSSFAYTYDNVGNVTQVTSVCPWLTNSNFTETFTYDASDQLTAATETQHQGYQLAVSYGNWGKISSYSLAQADLQNNTTQSETQAYTYPVYNSLQNSQTLFAPAQRTITDANNNVATETLTFGINGSLRKRDVQAQNSFTEYYLFNSAANLKAYSNNGLDFAYYGYNASNTRTYKLSFLNQNQWVNGQPEPLDLQLQSAMFYPNAYINFNQNGEYTKHYYNGAERIASRLGSSTQPTDATSNDRLEYRMMREEEKFRENIQELVSDGQPVDFQGTVDLNSLQPVNATSDIFYYHTNHLGSTAYVTDNNATITQGFLYAPFGEITTEYNATFYSNILPKYSFNAKELDEETGMYYYEARYYKPPVFTSRDPMFEKYFWMTPYAYCANNPVKYVDPSGREISTHTDADGNVVAVYNDGDNGVYKHNGNRSYTNAELKLLYSKSNPSAGGEKMGETEFWDEFVSPETGETLTETKIQFGKSFMPIIKDMHEQSLNMDLAEIANKSMGGGVFDIKSKYSNVGGLLNGKYATSRSAGNFLAAYNASTGKKYGFRISFDTFQRLAGALHIQESSNNKLTNKQMRQIVLTGTFNPSNPQDIIKFIPPTYGEVDYQYRMSKMGWDFGRH
ncbi:MAG: hypothetical protein J6S82_05670, partial [Bacteroidales bacterium]|nr:hypothetical protein [Bacteroidales bacterium]